MPRAWWLVVAVGLSVGCVRQAHRPDGKGALLGEGMASFYGPGLYGRLTASGVRLERGARLAAHRTLAFGTCIVVEATASGRTTRVRIADRGPFVAGRVLDVTESAADDLGMRSTGLARVRFWHCE